MKSSLKKLNTVAYGRRKSSLFVLLQVIAFERRILLYLFKRQLLQQMFWKETEPPGTSCTLSCEMNAVPQSQGKFFFFSQAVMAFLGRRKPQYPPFGNDTWLCILNASCKYSHFSLVSMTSFHFLSHLLRYY